MRNGLHGYLFIFAGVVQRFRIIILDTVVHLLFEMLLEIIGVFVSVAVQFETLNDKHEQEDQTNEHFDGQAVGVETLFQVRSVLGEYRVNVGRQLHAVCL